VVALVALVAPRPPLSHSPAPGRAASFIIDRWPGLPVCPFPRGRSLMSVSQLTVCQRRPLSGFRGVLGP
jgi:hypothetical protein